MSGVLERMAKRALRKLPTVQPLIRSIYAAPPVHAGESIAPGPAPRNIEAETSAPTAVSAPARVREPQPSAPRPTAPVTRAADEKRQAEPSPAQARPKSAEAPRVEAPVAPPTQLSPEPERVEKVALAPAVSRQDEIASIVSELAPHTIAPPHLSQPIVPPLQRRRLRPAGGEPAAPAEQKAEIHISIGNIELRAAPAEPKPPAPAPFRPRVSLQEFLSRDRGARR